MSPGAFIMFFWLIAWLFAGHPGFGIAPLLVFGIWCGAMALLDTIPRLRPLIMVHQEERPQPPVENPLTDRKLPE